MSANAVNPSGPGFTNVPHQGFYKRECGLKEDVWRLCIGGQVECCESTTTPKAWRYGHGCSFSSLPWRPPRAPLSPQLISFCNCVFPLSSYTLLVVREGWDTQRACVRLLRGPTRTATHQCRISPRIRVSSYRAPRLGPQDFGFRDCPTVRAELHD